MSHKIETDQPSFTQQDLWDEITKYKKQHPFGIHLPKVVQEKTEIPVMAFVRHNVMIIPETESRSETAEELRGRLQIYGLSEKDLDSNKKMLKLCFSSCRFFPIVSKRLRAKEAFVKRILAINGGLLEHVEGGLSEKENVVAIAMYNYPAALQFAGDRIRSSIRFLEMIQNIFISHSQPRTRKDLTWPKFIQGEPLCNREFAMRLVKINRVAFQYLDPQLREDKDLLWEAVHSKSADADFEYTPLAFTLKEFCDKELLLAEVKRNAEFIKYATDELKRDKSFVLEVLELGKIISGEDYSILSHIDESLCDDDEVVLKAVEKNSMDIRFASSRLKNKREIFDQLIKSVNFSYFKMTGNYLLEIAGDDLKDDEEFVLMVVKENIKELQYASERVRSIREVALRMIEGVVSIFNFTGEVFYYSGQILNEFSESIRDDEEVVFEFVKKNAGELQNASSRIKNNETIIRKFVAECKKCYVCAGEEIHGKYGADVENFIQASIGRGTKGAIT